MKPNRHTRPWSCAELVNERFVYTLGADGKIGWIHLPGGAAVQVVNRIGIFLQGADGHAYAAPMVLRGAE